ncbi:hypothetical protein V8E55_006721 [Tylopilus felleus]
MRQHLPSYLSASAPTPLAPGLLGSSQDQILNGSSLRASQSRLGKAGRLARSQLLNKYMPRLYGKCLYHFVQAELLLPDHFPCEYLQSEGNYAAFRRSFVFAKYEYCFCCGVPQDQRHNGECPAFHANLAFGKCGYNHILFKTAFCVWQNLSLRTQMIQDLDIEVSITHEEDFSKWAQEIKATDGKYHNCAEAFLWFCGRLERRCSSFFL